MSVSFEVVAQIAGRQHGRISHAQLLAAGIDRDRIKRWRADGRLRPVYRGVYAVGHSATFPLADLMAAVLACGEAARASHRSVLYARGVLRTAPPQPEVSVTSPGGRRRRGIVVHRRMSFPHGDTLTFGGIRMTTVPRALLDVATSLDSSTLCRACHDAWVLLRVTPAQIEECIARNPMKPGAAKLRRACGADATLSELELAFLVLLDDHGLPRPRTNVDVAGSEVDCHWPHHGMTIELHSYRFHESRWAFENDTARRRRSGHLPFTWGDVFERAAETAEEVRALLAAGRRDAPGALFALGASSAVRPSWS